MALDISGIGNVGEFFSQHYLDALLERDLKDTLTRWADRKKTSKVATPQERLARLAESYFRLAARAEAVVDPAERLELTEGFHAELLEALGYERRRAAVLLDDDRLLPVLYAEEQNHKPWLWIVEAPFPVNEDEADPLGECPLLRQVPEAALEAGSDGAAPQVATEPWRELFDGPIFRGESPPRWVIFVAGRDIFLLDRDKWHQGKHLRFELGRLLGLREPKALQATAGLLHREVLVPEGGQSLLERLDEESHKHAFAVSTDLMFGAQQAIELLGNEAIRYRLEIQKKKTYDDELDVRELTRECITYLYRLLFLFYVEARGSELGVVPMQSDAFRLGYSLESLRDLELVPLTTDEARNGTYLGESLRKLFHLIQRGHAVARYAPAGHGSAGHGASQSRAALQRKNPAQLHLALGAEPEPAPEPEPETSTDSHPSRTAFEPVPIHETFVLRGLRSPLFDEERTPILRAVRFRNQVIQEVLRLLSLSREGKGKARGRISYAQLGINQLGAVYEGLLSYTGFFATEELFEVQDEKEMGKDDARTYFVPASQVSAYKKAELVKDQHGRPRKHPKGAFLFRLAGRDRERSASYYTPEVLTRCLTKYTLKVRLGEPLLPGDSAPCIGDRPRSAPRDSVAAALRCSRTEVRSAPVLAAPCAQGGLRPGQPGTVIPSDARAPQGGRRLAAEESLERRLAAEESPERRLSADEILELCVCEPAMGSGAFLNEAVSQLAEQYLEKKQAELGRSIPAEEYQAELGKVKYHFVVHNTYGVDLNPLAAELGKISLWLGVLQPGVEAPYLDQRLRVGNSLMGARREVYAGHLLTAQGKGSDSWLSAVPERVPLREAGKGPSEDVSFPARPKNSVYHFLVPDAGMVAYADDAVVKDLRGEEAEALRSWRKAQLAPYSEAEVARLATLSEQIDRLWEGWAKERCSRAQRLRQPIRLWGQADDEQLKAGARDPSASPRFISVEEAEEIVRLRDREITSGSRLGLVMDYWGALWFWPVLEAELAPSREEWLGDAAALLEGGAPAMAAQGKRAAARLEVVRRVAREQRFFHWELGFAEVFAQRGGMDVFLGNPPWIRVEWSEAGVLGDIEPLLNLRKLSAKQVADRRREVLSSEELAGLYLGELANTEGQGAYLASGGNFPLLRGVKGNLYKCFLETNWRTLSPHGAVGLWHQPGLFDDPRGGALRGEFYARARLALAFRNELELFSEIGNVRPYAATVSSSRSKARLLAASNLLHPRTLDESLCHDGCGPVPGIKTEDDHWDLRGHRSRLVRVDDEALALFARLYDPPGTPPSEARLPVVHSAEILEVLRRFAEVPRTLGADRDSWFWVYDHLDESRQQKDGTIRRETRFPSSIEEWILSGPHVHVGTPFNKTPNEGCSSHRDYSPLDLTQIPDDYLPRTNYVPGCSEAEFRERTPEWRGKRFTEYYRHVHRRMLAPTGERTLVAALIPPGAAHIHPVISFTLARVDSLLVVSALACSLPLDFFVKTTGKSDLYGDAFAALPFPEPPQRARNLLSARALRLNCLTTHYADLWQEVATKDIAQDGFAKQDPRLGSWSRLKTKWSRESALRTPYERRQALVELDALAALSLGLTLEQLLLIYRVQFPVLQQYERETYYDQRGKIVFTTNRGLSGVGLDRKQWEEIQDAQKGAKLPAWAKDAGGAFVPPFDSCDREADMAEAYRHFEAKLGRGLGRGAKPKP